jgi:DNA-binding CsgD family transcriptional regulator
MGNKRIILNKDELYQKYIIEKLSQKDTAVYFNCSVDTVVRNLKEYEIESHKAGSWSQTDIVQLNEYQKEILNGAMLGDGSLIVAKCGVNAQFTYTSKSKQHVEFVCSEFMEYSYKEGIKYTSFFDKRTNKTYERYTFRTITDKGFTSIYNKWYKNRIKHLPDSLILTPTTCLVWYIGDGCLSNSKRSQYIKLATQCFTKEEQEKILLPQLSQFEATIMKADKSTNGEQQYYIYIPHKCVQSFLDYIGECPFSDYDYKWNVVGYKNKQPQNHTFYEKEFCDLYKKGMTYYAIAKQFGIEPNAVKYYLIKNNLYKKGN